MKSIALAILSVGMMVMAFLHYEKEASVIPLSISLIAEIATFIV